ncbi:MAG: hypothetical protein IPI00_15200 [Flavobacteriales bacterium]|nr:hypothetical protein [Flavobacteriales bacterium]MBK6945358.1 hypothetical protein [Flavobacteriales bacterium]MBK7241471.1 hypothetical protein [Flavobacteriales bacterium]MBK7298488.1 hypothetical protein [Flavobacteriales bacterium]MBK9535084.1 hypothetical protein [Flavobacteriales bacterium]
MNNSDPKKKKPEPIPGQKRNAEEQPSVPAVPPSDTEAEADQQADKGALPKSVQGDHGAPKPIVNPGPEGDQ